MKPSSRKMESSLTGMWVSFFTAAGIPSDVAATYALTFTENRIQTDMLLDLNKEYLRDMGITRMGDVIAILRHAKQVHETTARDRVLGTTPIIPKVPVAAITGRLTSAQTKPSSPVSRILEHYTRNATPDVVASSVPPISNKRKLSDFGTETSMDIKKTRMIRFAASVAEEEPSSKQTVFARLGQSDLVKAASVSAPAKPIFSRLGAKTEITMIATQDVPVPRDALKYEGILKSSTSKKVISVTTSKDVRKIALGTMRADEAPLSVKEKLAQPKAKSVKFSNTVQYKEIEAKQERIIQPNALKANQKLGFSTTQVFNKPERRLSMPEGGTTNTAGVKARLGVPKNTNSLTITKNIFNRLGV